MYNGSDQFNATSHDNELYISTTFEKARVPTFLLKIIQ